MSNVRRLYRSRHEKKLGGVCGGLAEYFGIDVSLLRLAWILFAVLGGSGLLAYILAWIVIPEEP
jgi:phage shock protein PspC (stress-responsive transcriptional regulator)